MKIRININQQLDKSGDEFLDERNFDMELIIDSDSAYAECSIGCYEDCFIKISDLKQLAKLFT